MVYKNADIERRDFIKRAVGIGTLVWLTLVILTVSAKKGYARFSGDGNANGLDNNPTIDNINPGRGRGRPGLDP
jgi:hypothetical protein